MRLARCASTSRPITPDSTSAPTLQRHLAGKGHQVVDHGPTAYDPLDDYPSFCINAAKAVVADHEAGVDALDVVLGGSATASRWPSTRCTGREPALVLKLATAELAQEHNNKHDISMAHVTPTLEEGR